METLTPADFAEDLNDSTGVGRRVFIKGLGFVGIALLLSNCGSCEKIIDKIKNRPMRRRLRTGSAEVDADIETYRQAVAAMKGLPAGDARKWEKIAEIHGTPAGFNFCEHGTIHFFDWHRGYLLNFERICQKLTGNDNFGLPYWNWNQDFDIHPAFLDSSSTLFMSRSRTSMTGSTSTSSAQLNIIFGDSNFFTFSAQLEGTPHNDVHTYIDGTLGGFTSALDPLFWMHHCMVDYCWYKWNVELGNNNTNDPNWANHVNSHYVDADGNPASATAAVTTLMPFLSYQYESSAIGSAPAKAALTKEEFEKVEKRIKEGANIRFEVKQRIRVAERAEVSIARPFSKATRVAPQDFARILSDSAQERAFVSIEFAQLPPTSDFWVRVFINHPNANAGTSTDDPHFAGTFSFFGTQPRDAAATGAHRHQPKFLVNITHTLQKLRSSQELKEDTPISVHLVPVPFAGKFEREDTQLLLSGIEIITTPVIINPPQ